MNTRLVPELAAAALLLSPLSAIAVTETWDGGAPFDDLLSTGTNWADNSAPVSDLVNTDLIFGGLVRTTPDVGAIFSTHSVTFNNTANPFTIGGQRLNIGSGGIANSDTQTMTFTNAVNFGVTSMINASAGRLVFTGLVTLPSGTLTVTGGFPTTFNTISGAGTINKTGAGVMSWTPDAAGFDMKVGAGTLTLETDGSTNVFSSTSSIEVNGSATFNLNESVTLDGAQLTRAGGASLNLAAGKTLTVQNGGDAAISGGFANNTDSTITVTGAGSTFSTSTTLSLSGGSTLGVSDGGSVLSGTGLTTVDTGSSIAITGGTCNALGNLTLNGGQLTRNAVGALNLNAGTLFTVQAGGDATITGGFSNATASNILVTGAGSTLTTTATLSINGGSTLGVSAGAGVSTGAGPVNVGTSGNGAVAVSSAGSSLSGDTLHAGTNGNTSSITFSNSSTGAFAVINVDNSGVVGTSALLEILSGAVVTGTALALANQPFLTTGTVTINGASSALTLTGAAPFTSNIGAASGSSGTLNVQSSGTFNSGTGLTTVNVTGTVAIAGGTFNANGDLTLNGGQLTRDLPGVFALDAGKTFAVQSGGDATFTGAYTNTTASSIVVTGAGSTLSTSGDLGIQGGSMLNVAAGGSVSSSAGPVNIGAFGANGTATVDGAGSNLSGNTVNLALNGHIGNLTFTNGSTGAFGIVGVSASNVAATNGTLSIQSGASVTGTSLSLASIAAANTGTVTITDAGSALTISGAATIGAASNSTGVLNVNNGGTFDSGAGLTTVNATGTISIDGGVYNSNGDLTINGGEFLRGVPGTLSLDPGTTLTVQAGGDATIAGNYFNSPATTVTVTGAGSEFSSNSTLRFDGAATLNVLSSGRVSSGGGSVLQVGFGGGATAIVDGAGSIMAGGGLLLGGSGDTSLTFRNGSTGGQFGAINVSLDATGATAILQIESGATVSGTALTMSNNTFVNTGVITITGPGSALTIAGPASLGAASAGTATINVQSGGTFTTGSGLTTVNATGALNVNAGGTLTGASDFGGTGPVSIAGAYLPGTASGASQTTSVSFAQNMTFQPATSITMELGGLAPGTQHDQLVFNGPGTPHVTWNGTLNVVLINGFTPQAGHTFNLFDFDAARDAGTFSSINVVTNGLMPAGLGFDFSELYTTGIIRVVSTAGITFSQWATASGIPGAQPDGNHDGDSYDNLTEYALALFPVFPGASEPSGGFHLYPEGERMRVLFWRHIDRTDITIRVLVSTDLTNWDDLAVSVNSAPFTGAGFVSENRAHPLSEPGLVEVRDILNVSSEVRRYVRILVSLSP